MSRGYGGHARVVAEDEYTVIYEYAPYDWNHPEYRNKEMIHNGTITIDKRSLVEPEIHTRIKHWPSGRKEQIVKRVHTEVDYSALAQAGQIIVERSPFDQHDKYGLVPAGVRLTWRIFDYYQVNGKLPKRIEFFG